MRKLKLSKSKKQEWVRSVNKHIGRQLWEFDPHLGTKEERAQVEQARKEFNDNRFKTKHSFDLLMRLQFERENGLKLKCGKVRIEKEEDMTEELVGTTLRRALRCYSTMQAEDGFWSGDYGGPMFLLPGLVLGLWVTGALNAVLTSEHQSEIRRYLFNHQNKDGGWGFHIDGGWGFQLCHPEITWRKHRWWRWYYAESKKVDSC